ncbi:MAG: hypothetical protein AAB319_02610, partial [Pseudomonadota bacterium]
LEAHGGFGLLRKDAAAIIDRVASATREWRMVFEELEVPGADCDKVASAFRRPRDVGLVAVERALHARPVGAPPIR